LALAIPKSFEDVPQITINIFIALCREDAISYYQIIKAGVIIFGGLIRVLMGFLRFGDRQSKNFALS
jgi:Na+(H+)/acetate symporter ActP